MRKILAWLLYIVSRLIIGRYKPVIVAITGSVGKTSTKEACLAAIGKRFRVRGTAKNYNTEIGVPLAIIGAKSGGASPVHWLLVFIRALVLLVRRDLAYPEVLVLEMAADKPGDIAHLVKLAPPHIGIITAITPTHTEFFGSVGGVAREKMKLIAALPPDSTAILNKDAIDPRFIHKTRAQVVTYGFASAEVDISGSDLDVYTKEGERQPVGVRFKVTADQNVIPMILPGVLGAQHPTAALAAVAAARAWGVNLVDIADGLRIFSPPASRMRILPGIKETIVIDDTYNASPAAMHAALDAVAELPLEEGAERIAVLGDMLELGALSEDEHAAVGKHVAEKGFDMLITVGALGKIIAGAARGADMPESRVASFDTAEAARKFVQDKIEVGDVVLVKGSKRTQMVKIVYEIMAEPERAPELLANSEYVG